MTALAESSETASPGRARGGTMKALVQQGRGSADALQLQDVSIPTLTEGRVLVRMRAASVNALDWHTTHGGLILEIASEVMRRPTRPGRSRNA